MPSAFLGDRGVLRVAGADACAFLQGLVTCNVARVAPGHPAYGALLTPQGKITADFIVSEADGAHWLDCSLPQAAELAKRLRFYKLRANVEVADVSATHGVAAMWGAGATGEPDPRHAALGNRVVGARAALAAAHDPVGAALYDAHRIALGIPKGGVDFAYGDAFPHEANLDLLHGVDFRKGCYVGQEVVSRVEHRGAARKRVTRVNFTGAPPLPGAPVRAGDIEIGVVGSIKDGMGLAMLRLDRVREAAAAQTPLLAGGALVTIAA